MSAAKLSSGSLRLKLEIKAFLKGFKDMASACNENVNIFSLKFCSAFFTGVLRFHVYYKLEYSFRNTHEA